MEEFFKNLKDRFSIDNVVSFMKDAKLVDGEKEKEEDISENKADDIPRTTTMDVDGTPIIINDVESISKTKLEGSSIKSSKNNISDKSGFNILQKPSSHEVKSDPDQETSEKPAKKPDDIPFFF